MPIRKSRLSRQEEARNLDCLQQLKAEGHDVEIPEKWRENAVVVPFEITGITSSPPNELDWQYVQAQTQNRGQGAV